MPKNGVLATGEESIYGRCGPGQINLFETDSTPAGVSFVWRRGISACLAPTSCIFFGLLGDKILAKQSLYYSKREFYPVRKMERLTDIYITW